MKFSLRLGIAALGATLPSLALAHTGFGATHGFLHGFAHPLGGLDHVLTMVAVGTFAVTLGGRALWAVPLSFLAFMLVGGGLGFAGIPVPFVEAGIALSIVVLGVAVAIRAEWPVAAAMGLVALFATFHGHAHGTEMPLAASGLSYALGFVAASGLLHLAGIGLGFAASRSGALTSHRVTQAGGAAVALAGVVILTGAI